MRAPVASTGWPREIPEPFGLSRASAGSSFHSRSTAKSMIAVADRHGSAGTTLTSTVTTLLVFWLAHVYTEVPAQRLHIRYGRTAVVAATAQQLPMLEAPALSVLFLLLAVVGVLDRGVAVSLALANGVTQLFA
jgi:hypothetical protein